MSGEVLNRPRPSQGCAQEPPSSGAGHFVPRGGSAGALSGPLPLHGPIRITVGRGRPTPNGEKFEARLGGRLLCSSRTPFLSAARRLIAEGHDPRTTLEMAGPDGNRVDLRATLGRAAELTVRESDRGGPTFARYTPPPRSAESA